MRRITCLFVALFALAPLGSARAEASSLTAKEIAAGWIMLFDGETDFGWKQPDSGGRWAIADGAMTASEGGPSSISTTTAFGAFEMRGELLGDATKARPIGIKTSGAPGAYRVHFLTERGKTSASATWMPFAVRSTASRHVIELQSDGKGSVKLRNLKLRPLGLESIFNGKDLTGWKVVPGHPSVFSVTPEGWMNVTNGNGDIQTERSWGDFALQIEVFSNGDHLNSGVFFRANPGKFWSGYEDQIRNQWQGEDRNKAVDYGTGGIYNRQPARKVVSSDREWFTMTLVAHGKHISSWVNGYQVADFTDMRPEDQTNARSGARTEPGVLSLQGHDPTTNLNFRNIRIAELPK